MKKLIATLLAAVLLLTLAACGGTANPNGSTPAESGSGSEVAGPASALELLQNIWAAVPEDNKFMVMGGSAEASTMGEPGAVAATDADTLSFNLLVPAEQHANIDDAASMLFAMNANSFTAGAFHVTGDMDAFTKAMRDAVQGNTWMCGFPEQLLIHTVGDYAVVVFGLAGVSDPEANFLGIYSTALAAAYPNAVIAIDEPIA